MPPKSSRSKSKRKYQIGGSRTTKSGDLEVQVIPIVNGKPQLGGAFWDKAWKWVKGAANTVGNVVKPVIAPLHDAVKKSGIIGNAVAGFNPAAGMVAKQLGYGRIIKRSNAMRAAR